MSALILIASLQLLGVCFLLFICQVGNVLIHASLTFVITMMGLYALGKKKNVILTREHILRLSKWIFFVMWVMGLCGYCCWYASNPQIFGFSTSKLILIAPTIAFAPACMSAVLTLCAGDTVLPILQKNDDSVSAEKFY